MKEKSGFVELKDVESLNRFLDGSAEEPVVLLKHSNSCGVSSRAYREMAQLNRPVGLVTVQKARDVSNEIERRFGLAHETPQVVIVRGSKVVWNASHSRVSAHAIEEALGAVSSGQQ